MNWLDGRDSCTCSCTRTGPRAQIPTELRRGSANKTQTVILEVLTMPRSTQFFYANFFSTSLFTPCTLTPALIYYILLSLYFNIKFFSLLITLFIYIYIFTYIFIFYTMYIMLHVFPVSGVLGWYVYLLYCHIIYIYLHTYQYRIFYYNTPQIVRERVCLCCYCAHA